MLETDLQRAQDAGADAVFAPSVVEMYPTGTISTRIDVGPIDQILCGVKRPTHFSGVATVVVKLLSIITPSHAVFGAKDAQQLAVIRQVVRDLNLPVDIIGADTVRESDGLALSSRNQYLTTDERERAPAIFRALGQARAMYRNGERSPQILTASVIDALARAGIVAEYVELRAWDSLEAVPATLDNGPVLLAVAASLGRTRLIDNVILE